MDTLIVHHKRKRELAAVRRAGQNLDDLRLVVCGAMFERWVFAAGRARQNVRKHDALLGLDRREIVSVERGFVVIVASRDRARTEPLAVRAAQADEIRSRVGPCRWWCERLRVGVGSKDRAVLAIILRKLR